MKSHTCFHDGKERPFKALTRHVFFRSWYGDSPRAQNNYGQSMLSAGDGCLMPNDYNEDPNLKQEEILYFIF